MQLDLELLDVSARRNLLEFLRHPFTDESCGRVERELPSIAPAYRALASTRVSWESIVLPPLVNDPTAAFMPVVRIDAKALPPAPMFLLQAQVELLHTELRDHQEVVCIRSGCAMSAGGTSKQTALALQAFAFHEAVFLTFSGLFQACQLGSLIEFSLTPLGEECLRGRVHCATMQNFTEGAMHFALQAIIREIRSHSRVQPERIADGLRSFQLDKLEIKFLDTYFSLSSRMQADPKVAPRIAGARQLCRWMALLALVRIAGEESFQPDAKLLAKLKLDPALPGIVIGERGTVLSSDKGIYRTPSGAFMLDQTSLGHAISCCKGAVLSDAVAQSLGDDFELHVKSYVENCIPPGDYIVREGFKASGKGEGCNYDCDLILYEPKRQKIFFVQTKWKRQSRTANLADELTGWMGKKPSLVHGMDQLQGLRARLSEKRVLNQVKGRLKDIKLTGQKILENSHFILVHTLPDFNAYEREGIVLYEWNFFRNILLRGTIQRTQTPIRELGKLHHLTTIAHHETLPLENPECTLNHFYRALGLDMKVVPQAMDARLLTRYGFDVDLQQRPAWWRRLFGRRVVRVARPYI
ncbi:MAG: hypothetical protein Q7K57_08265 [Burkholderiaceae bacterium]|nr:hypothetical protein [Burkholderiaceae bacterium]